MRLPLLLSSLFCVLFMFEMEGQTARTIGPPGDPDNEPPLILAEGDQYYCPLGETPVVQCVLPIGIGRLEHGNGLVPGTDFQLGW